MSKRYFIQMAPSDRLPKADAANNIMEQDDFKEYVAVHGYHFTDKLADWASSKMVNASKAAHSWSSEQAAKAYKDSGYAMPESVTTGDVGYLANMAYADYYPVLLKSDGDCMKYVRLTLEDEDGYPEVVFMRWIADMIGKNENVEWEKYI